MMTSPTKCFAGMRASALLLLTMLIAGNGNTQTFQYHPILYQPGDNLTTPYHAWLVFEHPVTTDVQFLNARLLNLENGTIAWMMQNLPIAPEATPRPIYYRLDLTSLSDGPASPEFLLIEWLLGNYQVADTFTAQAVESLVALPVPHFVPTSAPRLTHNFIPFIPPIFLPPVLPDTIEYLTRECNVPNVDLDSIAYPDPVTGDVNSCAPAAAANSLRWLMDVHPDIFETDSLRGILEEIKMLMEKDSTGVTWEKFVQGKLAYIDEWQLPIRVKYQVHTPYPGFKPIIEAPDSTYGHAAENETMPGGWPAFDWICSELKDGEDVEMSMTYWCDSSGVMVQQTSHSVNLTGYFKFGNDRWLVWKHDTDQSGPGGAVEEYGRWCVDTAGYPFLKEMSETAGCIAYVGSVVSESYDPTVLFEDITEYQFKYRPIEYLTGSVQDGYPYHAWLTFNLPFNLDFQFLNVLVCNPVTGERVWLLQNVPLPDGISPMPVRIKMDLGPLVAGDSLPDPIIIKYHIGDFQTNDSFPVQSYATLGACPETYVVPNGGDIGFHPLIPRFPPLLVPVPLPPPIESLLRGCEVPNVDLDSSSRADDWNACGPAAAANSLQWLDDQHEEINIPIELRAILDSLKSMMNLDPQTGVGWIDFIKGKLEFIDEYKLPIHVKYQAHRSAPASIPSPNPLYGHEATNESPPDPNNDTLFQHPQFDWLCQELEAGEDVEMMFGFYCDTTISVEVIDTILLDTLPDGTITMDTVFTTQNVDKKQRKSGHMIEVTGKVKIGPLKWITYKHDVHQGDVGGTTDDSTPDSLRYTDMSEWIEVQGGYAYLNRENYIEVDGDTCTSYVEMVVAESYDPDIEFCIEKVCIPDDDGEGSLREALACVQPGDTVILGPDLAGDTIRLTSGSIKINKDVVVLCDPSLQIYIEGTSVDRVFEVKQAATVIFYGLRIICGSSSEAACVENQGVTTFRDVEFFSHNGGLMPASQIVNTGIIHIEGTTNLRE